MKVHKLYLAGRCANGAERDKGRIYHAVPVGSRRALCGAEPGPRSAGWAPWNPEDSADQDVTCPRCRKKLAALTTAGGTR